jgi:hypothetical protein
MQDQSMNKACETERGDSGRSRAFAARMADFAAIRADFDIHFCPRLVCTWHLRSNAFEKRKGIA